MQRANAPRAQRIIKRESPELLPIAPFVGSDVPIEIDEEKDHVNLECVGRTVKSSEALHIIRGLYKGILNRQAKALASIDTDLERTLQVYALTVDAANKGQISSLHQDEWHEALKSAKKLLEAEVARGQKILERDIKGREEKGIFRNIVVLRKTKLRALQQDNKLRQKIEEDLENI